MALQSAEKYNQHQHVRKFSPPILFRLMHTRNVYMRTYVVCICMLLVNQWFMVACWLSRDYLDRYESYRKLKPRCRGDECGASASQSPSVPGQHRLNV